MNDPDQEKLEATLTAKLAEARNEEGAKNILALLFPKAERVLKTFIRTDFDADTPRTKRRIFQRDFAESYFTLSPDTDSWSQPELEETIKGSAQDAFNRLEEKIERAPVEKRPDLRRIFLELLDSQFSSIHQLDQEWLDAIIDKSPIFLSAKDEDRRTFFSYDNEDRLRRIIMRGLDRLPPTTQTSLLKNAIVNAKDLSVLSDVVRGLFGDKIADGVKRQPRKDVSDEDTLAVQQLLADRVAEIAKTDQFWHQARPSRLLWFWWGTGADVKAFTENAMKSLIGLRGLMETMPSEVKSTEGNYEHVPRYWDNIVDLDRLDELAIDLFNKSDNHHDVELAARFTKALARGRSESF